MHVILGRKASASRKDDQSSDEDGFDEYLQGMFPWHCKMSFFGNPTPDTGACVAPKTVLFYVYFTGLKSKSSACIHAIEFSSDVNMKVLGSSSIRDQWRCNAVLPNEGAVLCFPFGAWSVDFCAVRGTK